MKRVAFLLMIALICTGLLLPDEALAQFDVPAGFFDLAVVGGIPSPTALTWLPSSEGSDLLVTSQAGVVFRFDGSPPAEQILDVSDTVCSGGETGLLGLAVDPDFASGARFVYVYYTDRKVESSPCDAGNRANRVSRFPMNDQGQLVADDEQVLIDNISALNGNHNGGDLQFGNDGWLYISVGDAGQDFRSGGTQDNNGNARRLGILNGKILRITPEGGIPPGNPFQGPGTARCSETGQLERQGHRVQAEKKTKKQRRRDRKRKRKQRRRDREPATMCREIFATGLRNPYRIAFDPNDDQRFYINDVGGNGFEEINEGQAGADYGWNVREGPCPIDDIGANCSGSTQFEDPIFAYRTDHIGGSEPPFQGCRTITGGAFVSGGDWPGDYLFADFGCGSLFALTETDPGVDVGLFATGEGATHLAFGPDGDLYYTTFSGGGQVRKIIDE